MTASFDVTPLWWRLPLCLRQRWWRETDYGKLEPSNELRDAIIFAASNEGAKINTAEAT